MQLNFNGEEHPTLTDPFSGGGAIPLEGLRIGAISFATDLNPISFLLNKLIIEYIPTYKELITWLISTGQKSQRRKLYEIGNWKNSTTL